jgi:hypothetical protein
MDMRVYALDSRSGRIGWKSEPLPGAAFKDYWPVVYKDYVLVRPVKVSGGASGKPVEWLRGPLGAGGVLADCVVQVFRHALSSERQKALHAPGSGTRTLSPTGILTRRRDEMTDGRRDFGGEVLQVEHRVQNVRVLPARAARYAKVVKQDGRPVQRPPVRFVFRL